jgi:hypothetical protein
MIPLITAVLSLASPAVVLPERGPVTAPDFRSGRRAEVAAERRVSVVLLPEGYLEHERILFERHAADWERSLLGLTPFNRFRGLVKVSAVWVPSEARAGEDRKGYFGLRVNPSRDRGVADARAVETLAPRALPLMRLAKANLRSYAGVLDHAVCVLLVRGAYQDPAVGGFAVEAAAGGQRVRFAVGQDALHDFGQAFGYLMPEYISEAGADKPGTGPLLQSGLWDLRNIHFDDQIETLPWKHLVPGSPLNPDKESVVGQLWAGGGWENQVFHSEPECLMNGQRANWNLARNRRAADLRDPTRFCFWCEEILAARLSARAGLLGAYRDAEEMWRAWEDLRPHYHAQTDFPGRLRAVNEYYRSVGARQSPLMRSPRAVSSRVASIPVETVLPGWRLLTCGDPHLHGVKPAFGKDSVLITHPVSRTEPAVLQRRVTLATSPKLRLEVTSLAEQGVADWELVVRVDGRREFSRVIASRGAWETIEVDLGKYAGKSVDLRIENRAGGGQPWAWETGLVAAIEIVGMADGPSPVFPLPAGGSQPQ